MATGPGVNQGKTTFLEEFLPDHPAAREDAVNEAWNAAGNEGTISGSLLAKTRSKLGLTGGRGRKAGAARSPRGKRAKGRSAWKSEGRRGRPAGGGQGKSAFIRAQLGRDATLDADAINRAWTEAGHEGSIHNNLYYKVRADLGIKGRRGSAEGMAASSESVASEAGAMPPGGRRAARPGSSTEGGRDRALVEVEGEIDELIYRVRELGGLGEVQEALRAARRLLVRSHEA